MSIMHDWRDGILTDQQAIRALCMELGEVESSIDPLEKEKEQLRNDISLVLDHMGSQTTVYGFGDLAITSPSISMTYVKSALDDLCTELRNEGHHDIADRIEMCRKTTGKSGGLRITREKKR